MDKDVEAMVELLKELYRSECKKATQYLVVIFTLSVLLLIAVIFGLFLGYELSTYDEVNVTETTITETYENSIEGDGANIINGNQYNDNATHNEQ